MSDWDDLYPAVSTLTTSTTAPLPNVVSSLDLRTEFQNLVLGAGGETPIGRPFILRRMRRTDNDELIPCVCVDDIYHEADRDLYICQYCRGNGYLWDEELITAYKVVASAPGGSNSAANFPKSEPGTLYIPAARFFLPYDLNPKKDDRIVEIELDSAGDAVLPYNRIAVYEFMLVRAMRADNARTEYWICSGQVMGPKTQGSVS